MSVKLTVRRGPGTLDATPGVLMLDGHNFCRTLEDEGREKKVKGETRIPAGTYVVTLRAEGGMYERYRRKSPAFEHGMLHLLDVPGFTYILIHPGNTDDDTAGCLLVGRSVVVVEGEPQLRDSFDACVSLYMTVVPRMLAGEDCTITVEDPV